MSGLRKIPLFWKSNKTNHRSRTIEEGYRYTLKISRVKSHDFFSCDEKSHDFLCEKCVPCDFTRENFPRVMKNYTIFRVNECMMK